MVSSADNRIKTERYSILIPLAANPGRHYIEMSRSLPPDPHDLSREKNEQAGKCGRRRSQRGQSRKSASGSCYRNCYRNGKLRPCNSLCYLPFFAACSG